MKITLRAAVLLFIVSVLSAAETTAMPPSFSINAAERFANLALACVHKEYPNKLSHNLNSDADVAPPRKLTPAFYGCYDWHSSTADNIAQEAMYLRAEGRASFERPYGLAWLLQLAAELREWDDPEARNLAANLRPLEEAALGRLEDWLPKLSYPVRIGEHSQTAFALSLMLDYSRVTGDAKFADLLASKARQFYLGDKNCPLNYEPSGEDFLSPCLGEADLMRRVLPSAEFARWLGTFLPQISDVKKGVWLQPVVSPDPSDPKLAHLDGLNLSRAWMLEGISAGLPKGDKRLPMIMAAADEHRRAGLAAVTGKHYEGGHWLGSFAVYLVTRRGIPQKRVVTKGNGGEE